jgi:hypothetical protein
MTTTETPLQVATRLHRAAYIEMSQRAAAYSLAFRPPSFSANPQPEPADLVAKRNAFLLARDRFGEAMVSLAQAKDTEVVLARSGEVLAANAKLRDDEEAIAETNEWFDRNGRLSVEDVDRLAEDCREIARVANFHD